MTFIHRTKAKRVKKEESRFPGYSFGSKLEANTFALLKLRERAGEIRDIQVQDTIYLTAARIIYKPDFKYFDISANDWEWAESKGIETPEWRLKRRLWTVYGPGKLSIFMAPNRWSTTPVLKEIIIPKGEAA